MDSATSAETTATNSRFSIKMNNSHRPDQNTDLLNGDDQQARPEAPPTCDFSPQVDTQSQKKISTTETDNPAPSQRRMNNPQEVSGDPTDHLY